jgi:hypothetical protein
MGGEDRPAGACRFGDPLDRAVRLRGHISFCRYDKDCLVIAAEIRLRRPGPPKSFRHTQVSHAVRKRHARQNRGDENDDGTHDVARGKTTLNFSAECIALSSPRSHSWDTRQDRGNSPRLSGLRRTKQGTGCGDSELRGKPMSAARNPTRSFVKMVGFREQEVFMPQVDPWEKAADCERALRITNRSNPPRDPQQYPGILDCAGAREPVFERGCLGSTD